MHTARGVEGDDAGDAIRAEEHLARFHPTAIGKRERCGDALTVESFESAVVERQPCDIVRRCREGAQDGARGEVRQGKDAGDGGAFASDGDDDGARLERDGRHLGIAQGPAEIAKARLGVRACFCLKWAGGALTLE